MTVTDGKVRILKRGKGTGSNFENVNIVSWFIVDDDVQKYIEEHPNQFENGDEIIATWCGGSLARTYTVEIDPKPTVKLTLK